MIRLLKQINKRHMLTLFLIIIIIIVIIIIIKKCNSQPPKLSDISSIRVEYNQRLIKKLSLNSPIEINDVEQINQLVECFNAKSNYGIGCNCPSHDIIISFISEKKVYVYNIGITGDARIQYSEVPDKDIFGINIDSIINILQNNEGSENLEYPIG